MNRIEHEPDNGTQPYVVYWVKGRKRVWRAAFSSSAAAQQWIDRYGGRPPPEHMA